MKPIKTLSFQENCPVFVVPVLAFPHIAYVSLNQFPNKALDHQISHSDNLQYREQMSNNDSYYRFAVQLQHNFRLFHSSRIGHPPYKTESMYYTSQLPKAIQLYQTETL